MLVIFLLAVALNEVPELPEIELGIPLPEFIPLYPDEPLVAPLPDATPFKTPECTEEDDCRVAES